MKPRRGQEATELYRGIQEIMSLPPGEMKYALITLLDEVDARDSLEWLQALDGLEKSLQVFLKAVRRLKQAS